MKSARYVTGALHRSAQLLGAAGGKVGGPARAKALSESERSAIAKKGGEARQRQAGTSGKENFHGKRSIGGD